MTERPMPPAEARNLMPRHAFAAAIEKLNANIKKAAERDEFQVRIDWLCDIQGDKVTLTELGKLVVNAFEKEGYKVHDVYECRQFVDVGMVLSWKPA